jgi:hypothetical protein
MAKVTQRLLLQALSKTCVCQNYMALRPLECHPLGAPMAEYVIIGTRYLYHQPLTP